jgi:hypothetical protein
MSSNVCWVICKPRLNSILDSWSRVSIRRFCGMSRSRSMHVLLWVSFNMLIHYDVVTRWRMTASREEHKCRLTVQNRLFQRPQQTFGRGESGRDNRGSWSSQNCCIHHSKSWPYRSNTISCSATITVSESMWYLRVKGYFHQAGDRVVMLVSAGTSLTVCRLRHGICLRLWWN